MSLSATSIKRPVLAIVMSIILVIFGIVGFTYLEVREYPSVDPPIITVTTSYPGANAEIMETQITEPLEQQLNGIEGIKTLTSNSSEGQSRITIEFDLGHDLEASANDVRDRVSRSVRLLPPDINNPVVEKADADATSIIFMFVQSDSKDMLEVSRFANDFVKERIQTIPGVSAVRIFGERRLAMRMRLDPQKLAAFNMSPLDVQAAIEKENVELPAGRVEGDNTELTVRAIGRLTSVDDFNNLVIREENGTVIRFRDVGYAELGAENERTSVKRGGFPGIGVSVQALPGANVIEISNEFKRRLEQMKKDVPPEYRLDVGFDFSDYVRTTVSEVEETIIIAFALVVIIIFFFLRDWRSTIIPALAIPVSIIATFFVMYLIGFSINVLTLVGVILAIGLVVDDAIVVLENIFAKIEEGMSPIQAAFKGSREIYFAVISTTVALAAVFLPIIFLEGVTGRLFREFGVVVAGSVLISAFVALTLTPMLSSRLLKRHDEKKQGAFFRITEKFFIWLNSAYANLLNSFLKVRWMAFVVVIACGVVTYFVGGSLKSELAPLEDRSNVRISVTAPEGATFEFTDKYMTEITKDIMDSIPEVPSPIAIIGGFGGTGAANSGSFNLYLTPPDDRERTQEQVYRQLSRMMNTIPGVRAFPTQPSTIGSRSSRFPLQFVLQAPDFDKLVDAVPKFLAEANKSPMFTFVDSDLRVNKPEYLLTVNRQKAADLNVSVRDIAQTLQFTLSEQRLAYFIREGKQYQVLGQVERGDRDEPADLKSIYVRNSQGQLVQMDNLIDLREQAAPTARYRYNRFASSTISASLAPGYTLGDGIAEMRRIAGTTLDADFATALAGEAKDFEESSSSLLFTFLFAIIIIYLALAAQFESFVDPFIILLTVPMAVTGAVLSLWMFGQTLNIFSQIGVIVLIGLITKNGILIVEFANQKKEEGLNKLDAVKEAAASRFRPILMTSLAAILGILPIALGIGAGSRVSLGIVVVGGLIFSGFLTLFVIPAIYSYFSSSKAYHEVKEDEEEIELEGNAPASIRRSSDN